MPGRIDELFSPQRVSKNWTRPADADERVQNAAEASLPSGPHGARAEFDRLKRLISQRFPCKQNEALNIMVEKLRELLTVRFSWDAGSVSSETQEAEDEMHSAGSKVQDASAGKQEVSGVVQDGNGGAHGAGNTVDRPAIDQSIEDLLNHIEDLVEALEL